MFVVHSYSSNQADVWLLPLLALLPARTTKTEYLILQRVTHHDDSGLGRDDFALSLRTRNHVHVLDKTEYLILQRMAHDDDSGPTI